MRKNRGKDRREIGRKKEEMKANNHRANFSDKCFFQDWQ